MTRPPVNVGRARDIAKRVLAEGLSGSEDGLKLWPTTGAGYPRIPASVRALVDNLDDQVLSQARLFVEENARPYHGLGSNAKIRTLPTQFTLLQEHVVGEVVQSGNIKSVGWPKMEGTAPKNSLPNDTHYGKVKARKDAPDDMDWGAQSIPKPALPPISAADVGAPTKQEHKNLADALAKLRKKVNKLDGKN